MVARKELGLSLGSSTPEGFAAPEAPWAHRWQQVCFATVTATAGLGDTLEMRAAVLLGHSC